ncbi:hypothetical protein AB0K89_10635 [Streptomyces cinnamoneus]|uniref:hypothetical protein n=1 Tax=Streptomyces cinnamoneus TaxID=53446 RepID=UPI00341AF2B9
MNKVASRKAGSQPLRPATNTQHFLVGVVEERFQLGPGEGPSFRLVLRFVGVRRGVPVVDHLDWVGTEAPQALLGPAVGWVGQEAAELAHWALIVAQSGADTAVHGPQIGRPLVDVLRHPLPRHRVGVRVKARTVHSWSSTYPSKRFRASCWSRQP